MSSDLSFELKNLEVKLDLAVTHPPGADLRVLAYPLLVDVPGKGVLTEDRGISVARIVAAYAEHPDHVAVAFYWGTTPAHVAQALAYVADTAKETDRGR